MLKHLLELVKLSNIFSKLLLLNLKNQSLLLYAFFLDN